MSAHPLKNPSQPWLDQERYWAGIAAAVTGLGAPVGVVDLDAFDWNAASLVSRAAGLPIRVPTKSVRIRTLIDRALATPGFAGAMAYTLAEAVWLAEWIDDILLGYPSVDRVAMARLADPRIAERVTLMVDSVEHLDVIDQAVSPGRRPPVRVAIDLDVRTPIRGLGRLGVVRSPISDAASAGALAKAIVRRPGFRLVGVMAYEAQIAGTPDKYPDRPGYGAVIGWMKSRAVPDVAARRGAAVDAIREHAELEFVNGGGTGSIETTRADPSVTEIAAGSGLLGGHLFDRYRQFLPAPAMAFALPVVRIGERGTVTVAGGGWGASGPAGPDRSPLPVWPVPVRYEPREQAGEVQTPLRGPVTSALRIGDPVLFRHTKSGEPAEHLNTVQFVRDGDPVDEVPTYRGEGQAFL